MYEIGTPAHTHAMLTSWANSIIQEVINQSIHHPEDDEEEEDEEASVVGLPSAKAAGAVV